MSFKSYIIDEINEDIPEYFEITNEDLHDLIDSLSEEDYELVADVLLDILDEEDPDFFPEEEIYGQDNEELDNSIEEARFLNKKKGVRKFDSRKGALKRARKSKKGELRKKRLAYKITKKKNKVGKKKYRSTYNKAVSTGRHKKKFHR